LPKVRKIINKSLAVIMKEEAAEDSLQDLSKEQLIEKYESLHKDWQLTVRENMDLNSFFLDIMFNARSITESPNLKFPSPYKIVENEAYKDFMESVLDKK
jgi:hypothetical protein